MGDFNTALRSRLMSRVSEPSHAQGPNGCWEWTGYRDKHGYGRLKATNGKTILAHRASWIVHRGEIPSGKHICHSCDNPPCCNPSHLFLGTIAENKADSIKKGRHRMPPPARGEAHYRAVLTEADVQKIRVDERLNYVIAAEYGVHAAHIGQIKRRIKWAHVK